MSNTEPSPSEVVSDPTNDKEDRLKALAEILDERVHTDTNGPAYSAFSEAGKMLEMVLDDENPFSSTDGENDTK